MTTLPLSETPEWQKPVMFYGKPLEYYPASHRYKWDGQWVPSVTTILNRLSKPLLIQWAADCAVEKIQRHSQQILRGGFDIEMFEQLCEEARKQHTVIRDDAGNVGTLVHKYAEDILTGKGLPSGPDAKSLPSQAVKAIAAFREWYLAHKVEPKGIERRVFSRELFYAGKFDFEGAINERPTILDFKTGNGVYDEAWFQMAGYDMAVCEEMNWSTSPFDHCILHLDKKTGGFTPYIRQPHETEAAKNVFRCLVQMDKAIRQMPKMPKVKRAA